MDITTFEVTLVPVILALVQGAKQAGLPTKWAPLLSLVLGVGGVWAISGGFDLITGIVVGLSAAGLWSGTRATLQ